MPQACWYPAPLIENGGNCTIDRQPRPAYTNSGFLRPVVLDRLVGDLGQGRDDLSWVHPAAAFIDLTKRPGSHRIALLCAACYPCLEQRALTFPTRTWRRHAVFAPAPLPRRALSFSKWPKTHRLRYSALVGEGYASGHTHQRTLGLRGCSHLYAAHTHWCLLGHYYRLQPLPLCS